MIAPAVCQQRRETSVDKPSFGGMKVEKIKEKWEKGWNVSVDASVPRFTVLAG